MLIIAGYGIRYSFGTFFTSLEQEFGSSRFLTSAIFSSYMLLGSATSVAAGWAADRYGPRIVFLAMTLFSFLGLLLTSRAGALWQLFITYSLLLAIGTGPVYIVATSIAAKWFAKMRGLAIAIVTSGVGLGSIIMVPVAAYVIEVSGWRLSFLVLGLITLVFILPGALLARRSPAEIHADARERSPDAATTQAGGTNIHGGPELSIRQSMVTAEFKLIVIIWIFYSACIFTVMTHMVPHALDLGITPLSAASLVSVIGFATIPGRIVMGIVSDKAGRKTVALACALLMAASLVLLLFSSSLQMLYVFAVLFGIGYGGLGPPMVALVGDTFGVRHLGMIMGILEVAWVIGASLGPLLAGYIYTATGTYRLAFVLLVAASVIVIAVILFLRSPQKNTGESGY